MRIHGFSDASTSMALNLEGEIDGLKIRSATRLALFVQDVIEGIEEGPHHEGRNCRSASAAAQQIREAQCQYRLRLGHALPPHRGSAGAQCAGYPSRYW